MAKQPHLWKPGESGNPKGRPKGAKNKLTEKFFKDLCNDWETHGVSVLEAAREKNPTEYLRVVARLMPKDFTFEYNNNKQRTDTEVAARLTGILNSARERANTGDSGGSDGDLGASSGASE
jgi:hypothetical protein